MAGPKSPPTAEDIEALVEQVRHDPRSPAFVALGEAYLALGRPRDTIEIAQQGLHGAPDDHPGRLVLARAFAALHQWKEAQGELVRVVRVDRGNRGGFALLGEVLMRRGDHERAMPVLQHAQNLDPSSAQVLALLRAARSNQPLEPPAPIPTPVQPARRQAAPPAYVPPAPPRPPAPPPPMAPPPAPPMMAPPVHAAPPYNPPPPAPVHAPPVAPPPPAPPPPAYSAAPPLARPPAPPPVAPPAWSPPPPPAAPFPGAHVPDPLDQAATAVGGPRGLVVDAERGERGDATVPSLPPDPAWGREHDVPPLPAPPRAEVVRPRLLPQAKPVNAAAASLRQSAAVGENYLNDLLTGGLLELPGVRVPDAAWDTRPDRRWGRSAVRAFVALFVLLVLGIGGGGGWWWWSQRQKARAVAAHRDAAEQAAASGSWAGLATAQKELTAALKVDETSARTFAELARVGALRALVYGASAEGVDAAIRGAARTYKQAGTPGYRDLVIARAAIALTRVDGTEATTGGLADARGPLEALAAANPDDRWLRWLTGRFLLAAGQRSAAAAAFQAAADGDAGLPLAMIDRADLLVDDGAYDDAMKLYDRALAGGRDQVLAIAGKALARAERGTEVDVALKEANVDLDKELGPRVAAYHQLILALGSYAIQKHVPFAEALDRASGPVEPRFLARVAMARVLQGKMTPAVTALSRIKYASAGDAKPDADPLVALVAGALQWAGGEPETALGTLAKLGGTRAAVLRGQALYDLGRFDDAAKELAAAVAAAPDNVELRIWQQLVATATAAAGKAREQATVELEKTSRAATSKLGRLAHGLALLRQGDLRGARRRLEQALENVTPEEPNPLAYRTHAALAEVARAEDDRAREAEQLDLALTANPGYLPARLARAQVYLAAGQGTAAAPLAASVVEVAQYATAANFLLLAEAHARRDLAAEARDDQGKPRPGVTAASLATERRGQVLAALQKAKDAGAEAAELARVAGLVDPALATELGVTVVEEEPAAPPRRPVRRAPARRRGR